MAEKKNIHIDSNGVTEEEVTGAKPSSDLVHNDHLSLGQIDDPDADETKPVRALVVAYYFPPMGLSGVQRIAKFVKYLPEFGWEVEVLTVDPMGYYAYDHSLLKEVEATGVKIHRAPSKDPNRFFGSRKTVDMPRERVRKFWSRVSHFTLLPDSKIGWKKGAVELGAKILREREFDIIFSTAPPFTGHLIGAELSEISGVPFIADFRETWVDNSRAIYPTRWHKKRHFALERQVVRQTQGITTINRSIKEDLIRRHLDAEAYQTIHILPHGFDPDDIDHGIQPDPRTFRITYSGTFYDAQVPDYFLRGLARFFERNTSAKKAVRARFVGLPPENLAGLSKELGLNDLVEICGYKEHPEAVQLIMESDLLWLTLGHQKGVERMSTSKLYEYFGTRKPILGLLPPGEEATMLTNYGASRIVPPDDVDLIAQAIQTFYDQWQRGKLPRPDLDFVARFNRRKLTGDLARLFASMLHTA